MSPPGPGWALRGRANFRSREAPPVDAARARRSAAPGRGDRGARRHVWRCPRRRGADRMPTPPIGGHMVVPAAGGAPRFILPLMAPHRQASARTGRAWPGRWASTSWTRAPASGRRSEWPSWTAPRCSSSAAAPIAPALRRRPSTSRASCCASRSASPASRQHARCRCPTWVACWSAPTWWWRRDGAAPEALRDKALVPVSEPEIRRYATNGLPLGFSLLAPSVIPDACTHFARARHEGLSLDMSELCESRRCVALPGVARARAGLGGRAHPARTGSRPWPPGSAEGRGVDELCADFFARHRTVARALGGAGQRRGGRHAALRAAAHLLRRRDHPDLVER